MLFAFCIVRTDYLILLNVGSIRNRVQHAEMGLGWEWECRASCIML